MAAQEGVAILGVFVADLVHELERRGHELAYAVPRGRSRTKHVRLPTEAVRLARSFRPDVVYAHFLFPAGGAAALAARAAGAGLVVTAHGRDVRNIGAFPGFGSATKLAVRSARVIAVSDFLRQGGSLRSRPSSPTWARRRCGKELPRASAAAERS